LSVSKAIKTKNPVGPHSGTTAGHGKATAGQDQLILQRQPLQRQLILQRNVKMLRTLLIGVLLCAAQAAVAQELTAEQRNACMGDYEKYCKGVAPGGGRIIACLAKSNDKLTADCKRVLAQAEKK
jgi:hypothetical protein